MQLQIFQDLVKIMKGFVYFDELILPILPSWFEEATSGKDFERKETSAGGHITDTV